MDFARFKKAFTALLVGGMDFAGSICKKKAYSVSDTIDHDRQRTLGKGCFVEFKPLPIRHIAYVVINSIFTSMGSVSNAALNTSLYSNMSNVTAALKRMKQRSLFDIRSLLNRCFLHSEDHCGHQLNCRRHIFDYIYADRIGRRRWTEVNLNSVYQMQRNMNTVYGIG
jgi:hypothetical protein